jgi:uncharacterized protein (TIGR00369 family)
MSEAMKPGVMSVAAVNALLDREFPQVAARASAVKIEDTWYLGSKVRRAFNERSLRPGGTISGPTMMGLADFAIYVAILASVGPVPLAVTTNLNINFLRKPAQRDLIAEARLIKLGKRLVVGEVEIYSEGDDDMVAHATATYSMPPQRDR